MSDKETQEAAKKVEDLTVEDGDKKENEDKPAAGGFVNPFAPKEGGAANPFAAGGNPFAAAAAAADNGDDGSDDDDDDEDDEDDDVDEEDVLGQFMADFSEDGKKRILALSVLHEARREIESAYRAEYYELQKKYEELYKPLYEKRRDILNAEAPEDSNNNDAEALKDFWLESMQNSTELAQIIEEQDEPALKSLKDISSELLTGDQTGFRLSFHFGDNEYFSDKVLTKTYIMANDEDDDDDEVLSEVKGSAINWKPGKNLTVKVMKKKQRHGRQTRTVQKNEPCPSFFKFFDPPAVPSEEEQATMEEDELEERDAMLEQDYEIGMMIRESLIPKAIKYFTGEMADEGPGFELPSDVDLDEDDDDDEDFQPPKGGKGGKGKGGRGKGGKGGQAAAAAGQQECKQQ